MSQLYVRVYSGFYTHRKTLRLKAAIGDAAFWVPPRLWTYAAENEPSGEFKDYSATEIAMLIGYSGDASSMLQALLKAGFMDPDPLRIHDWMEHNRYHKTFSDRARTAALARHSKQTRTEEKKDIGEGEGVSSASSMLQAEVELPSGFPVTAEEAKRLCMSVAVPPEFIDQSWNKAVSRGGKDAKGVEIRSFAHYIATEWSYERGRRQSGASADHAPSEHHIKRNGKWVDRRNIGPNI